jgi:hypothetical protein
MSTSGLVDTAVPVALQAITLSTATLCRNLASMAQRIYGFFTGMSHPLRITYSGRKNHEDERSPHTGWCAGYDGRLVTRPC